MSVYTRITVAELEDFLSTFNLGRLERYSGIQAGIENTNYAVETSVGSFVLTIFEELGEADIRAVILLMGQLHYRGYPVPCVQTDRSGAVISLLKQKPAALFQRLPGHSIAQPSRLQCQELGVKLAMLHQFGQNTGFDRCNEKGLRGCTGIIHEIRERLPQSALDLIDDEFDFQRCSQSASLPAGMIHADLFRDNVLFCGNRISAVLDFYSACNDTLILDLAIACNDWCETEGRFDHIKMESLLTGYQSCRKLSEAEREGIAVYLRFAALRFWISRLHHQLFPLDAEITQKKDPDVFRRILEQHRSDNVQV